MVSKEKFIKDFMKDCKKQKKYGMKYLPGKMKEWGCKKAAERAWNQYQKHAPDNNKSRIKTSRHLYDNLTLRW